MRKVVIAGMLGNGLEWYDYALYGHMAFIISQLFFPSGDPTTGWLATFGVFAVGFIFRPLGAIFFGWFGDKYGRRAALVLAILMMAIPTGCIGLLPTYAEIGMWAPVLLTIIRIFQGLSLGGEFSGSITYIVEHAPQHKRGLAGAASIVSLILGFMLGSFVALATVSLLSPEDFQRWGWRLPFLIGIAIGLIGLYIRTHCGESPAYAEAKANGNISPTPLKEAFAKYPLPMFQAFAFYLTVTMPFYLLSIYLITFSKDRLGLPANEALIINSCAMGAMLCTNFASAVLSDRLGRKRIMVVGAVLLFAVIAPLFMWMETKTFSSAFAAQVLFGLILGIYLGPIPAVLVEMFPTRIRFTGMAISYNAAAALFGGTAPMACIWLIAQTGSNLSIAYYVMFCCAISLAALVSYKDRFKDALE